jgi:hypothetical protein
LNETLQPSPVQTGEFRLLADFIRELDMIRRNLSLYPPSHPRIAASTAATLRIFQQLSNTRPMLTLGIGPETVFFESTWLDKSNPTFRRFARPLAALGVAAIGFRRGLLAEELIRFNQILRSDRENIEKQGGFSTVLNQQLVFHIELTPIDYSAFKAGDKGVMARDLWEELLFGLLHHLLDPERAEAELPEPFNPGAVAALLNRTFSPEDCETRVFREAIGAFVSRLSLCEPTGDEDIRAGELFGELLLQLRPQLRRSFLDCALAGLEQNPGQAEKILETFPRQLLLETLQQQEQAQLQISSRLIDLVNRLATQPLPAASHRIKGSAGRLDKEIVRARLETLFREESQDLFMPGNYQQALKTMLDAQLAATLAEEERRQLKHTLEEQNVEQQCCWIIFEMLSDKLDPETENALQNNLVELSRFFLDTGDFTMLREIHRRWADFLYSDKTSTGIFKERVLTSQMQLTFMNEALDGVKLWGKEKFPALQAYVSQVGEAYTELLMERLAEEPRMALRRTWMNLLEGLGVASHPKIIAALGDKRWYLVRNLLIVLGRNPEFTALKAILQLTEHPHPRVRQEVLRILFRHNPATANRLLLKELASRDPETVLAGIQVADLSRDENVRNCLHQLLSAEMHGDSELSRKKSLLITLAKIGSPESLPLFQALLQKQGLLLSRRQKELQEATIRALADFPRRLAEPLLRELAGGRKRQQAKIAGEQLKKLSGGAS